MPVHYYNIALQLPYNAGSLSAGGGLTGSEGDIIKRKITYINHGKSTGSER